MSKHGGPSKKSRRSLLGLGLRFYIIDNLADCRELFSVRFGDFLSAHLVLKLLFESHNELNGVKRIGAEVVYKAGLGGDLLFVYIELVYDYLFNSLFDI